MITQRVGQLMEGDEFTPDDGETWMTVKETGTVTLSGGTCVLLVKSVSGKRWWGKFDEEVIVR